VSLKTAFIEANLTKPQVVECVTLLRISVAKPYYNKIISLPV